MSRSLRPDDDEPVDVSDFPTQSGIVVIMSRQLIRHDWKSNVWGAGTFMGLFRATMIVLAGLSPSIPMVFAAEYI